MTAGTSDAVILGPPKRAAALAAATATAQALHRRLATGGVDDLEHVGTPRAAAAGLPAEPKAAGEPAAVRSDLTNRCLPVSRGLHMELRLGRGREDRDEPDEPDARAQTGAVVAEIVAHAGGWS